MRMRVIRPSARLAQFVRAFEVIETGEREVTRLLLPDPAIIAGLRYRGSATQLEPANAPVLPNAAITGLRDTARHMRTARDSGIMLAKFREGCAPLFFAEPLHELFGSTLELADVVPRADVDRAAQRVAAASDDAERVAVFEDFLLDRLRPRAFDPLVASAVRAIHEARGALRVEGLARELGLSRDAFEKRFRRAVGASPKRLISILRLRRATESLRAGVRFSQLATEIGFYDQSHFNREVRAVTGLSPRQFFESEKFC